MLRPKAIAVKPQPDYMLLVDFDNGERRLFDVKPYLAGSWFGKLKDPSIFNSIHIGGLSVEWADGQDISPDDLYYKSVPIQDEPGSAEKIG